jgi:hypothetical protein
MNAWQLGDPSVVEEDGFGSTTILYTVLVHAQQLAFSFWVALERKKLE